MINKDIVFTVEKGIHKAVLGSSSVAVESNAKRIPKKTKEYLAEKLEDVVEFRNDIGRRKHGK